MITVPGVCSPFFSRYVYSFLHRCMHSVCDSCWGGYHLQPEEALGVSHRRLTNSVQMLQVVEFEALQQQAKPRMSPSLQVSDSSFCLCPRLLEALFRARDRAAAALTAADLGMLPNYIKCCRQIGARHNTLAAPCFCSLFSYSLFLLFSFALSCCRCFWFARRPPFCPWH